jgi:hypothetical protein
MQTTGGRTRNRFMNDAAFPQLKQSVTPIGSLQIGGRRRHAALRRARPYSMRLDTHYRISIEPFPVSIVSLPSPAP